MTFKFLKSLILFLFLHSISNAQTIPVRLDWKIQSFGLSNDSIQGVENKKSLYFNSASYPNPEILIPHFVYTSVLDADKTIKAEIKNPIFSTLSKEELSNFEGGNELENIFSVNSKVYQQSNEGILVVDIIPLRLEKTTGKIQKLISFDLVLTESNVSISPTKNTLKSAKTSVLKSGKWYKIKLNKDGVYKISYENLKALGFSQPEKVRLFGNGCNQLPVMNSVVAPTDLIENNVLYEPDGIAFYGKAPIQWNYDKIRKVFAYQRNIYSEYSYYFLTDYDTQYDNKIGTSPFMNADLPDFEYNWFNDYAYIEKDSFNLIKSGSQWFGVEFDGLLTQNYDFNFPNLHGQDIRLTVSLASKSLYPSSFTIKSGSLNTTMTMEPVSNYTTSSYATPKILNYTITTSGDLSTVQITYNKMNSISAIAWLDYLYVNANRKLIMTGNQMKFRNANTAGVQQKSKYNLTNNGKAINIWDITNPLSPKTINILNENGITSYTLRTDTLREFIAFENGQYLTPLTTGTGTGEVANQNIHGVEFPEYIVVTAKEFKPWADSLAEIHRIYDSLSYIVVTPEEIYNEFSSGVPDVSAIRNMVKMFYNKAKVAKSGYPRYLLLYGDGTFDNIHKSSNNSNFVPTYQSDNSINPISSFVTDDFFGLLDSDEGGSYGALDVGIGRMPVKNTNEAASAFRKIKEYISTSHLGDWRNTVCFIGDDADENQTVHMQDANWLADYVDSIYPAYNVDKIFLDAYPQKSASWGQAYPDVNESINNRVTKGALIVNYTGHGSELKLAHESVITINQINKWNNFNNLPIFMTATCEFTRFDDYDRKNDQTKVSAGEYLYLNPTGGAIALFTTTRVVFSGANFELNRSFYRTVFNHDSNGNKYRLGDIVKISKNITNSAGDINKRNFMLVGDPALQLNYPKYNVVTNQINGKNLNQFNDTLKAFTKVEVTGQITDYKQNLLKNFNGIIYPKVYDKYINFRTLSNDGAAAMDFKLQNNILYKGRAKVVNGVFSFNFVVPKDVIYKVGFGKISYYAVDTTENNDDFNPNNDASGFFKKIKFGEIANTYAIDTIGPQIQLYMDDESFVYGGITNENPKLLAIIEDYNGINSTGGIGHDIVAILDEKTSKPIILNEYYLSDLNTYQKGSILYQLNNLSEGTHTLSLKVWDIFNNSSLVETKFYVVKSTSLFLDNLKTFPNPFTDAINISFTHNQSNQNLEIELEIYDMLGKITFQQTIKSSTIKQITWNGKNSREAEIPKGVYLCKVKCKSADGQLVQKTIKIVKM